MDKLRDNSRLIVAGLITAGIIALLISNSGSNTTTDQTATSTETTQSQTEETDSDLNSDEESTNEATTEESNVEANTDELQIGSTPSGGPVSVETVDDGFQATVRKNDNQTVIVRQIVNDYLSASSTSLSAEKRLYIETVLVNALPRDEVIHVGDVISVSKNQLDEAVDASNKLSEVELKRWSKYL